jgi:hypothetical protein
MYIVDLKLFYCRGQVLETNITLGQRYRCYAI